jgi:hypothetical protein
MRLSSVDACGGTSTSPLGVISRHVPCRAGEGWRNALTIDIADRVPMTDLASIHARAAEGALTGKVVVLPTTARIPTPVAELASSGRV